MKKILIVSYSQTTQLCQVLISFLKPFISSNDFILEASPLKPKEKYPFPWPFFSFFDVFPESVFSIPCELQPLKIKEHDFDLVILAYTVWYLSPSIPIASFLQSDDANKLLKNKNVLTFIVCRNMWTQAQEKVKKRLQEIGANHIGNIAVTENSHPIASLVTTPRWMFTGKKEAFWKIFPPAGISTKEIKNAKLVGQDFLNFFIQRNDTNTQTFTKAIVDKKFILSEEAGKILFPIYAKLLMKSGMPGKRKLGIIIFFFTLITSILIVIPLSILFRIIFFPLINKYLEEKKIRYESCKI